MQDKTRMRGRHPGLSGANLLNYFAFGLPGIDGLPGLAAGLAAGFDCGLTDCDFIAVCLMGRGRSCAPQSLAHTRSSITKIGFLLPPGNVVSGEIFVIS
ncbi:MAG: hypothetical protein WA989_00975 [Henriciella sp.]|uniref:hypothetical protein n=1 Tax=Henriciella sp. TaxID=1968823 RepID=UPI003C742C39